MELQVKRTVTIEPAFIEVDAGVRYWEDAILNGVEDTEGAIPLRDGARWKPVIDLATGAVMGWPEGTEANVHYKVCDDGEYWLLDGERKRVAKWAGFYVPDAVLAQGGGGLGDYIILTVGVDGKIIDWKPPVFDADESDESARWKAVEATS